MPHKELVKIPRATLDFYRYEKDGLVFYEFDATQSSAPEPMMNAMLGLEMIKNENERLVGFFFHQPMPLLQRIEPFFTYDVTELDNGDFRLVFKRKLDI